MSKRKTSVASPAPNRTERKGAEVMPRTVKRPNSAGKAVSKPPKISKETLPNDTQSRA